MGRASRLEVDIPKSGGHRREGYCGHALSATVPAIYNTTSTLAPASHGEPSK